MSGEKLSTKLHSRSIKSPLFHGHQHPQCRGESHHLRLGKVDKTKSYGEAMEQLCFLTGFWWWTLRWKSRKSERPFDNLSMSSIFAKELEQNKELGSKSSPYRLWLSDVILKEWHLILSWALCHALAAWQKGKELKIILRPFRLSRLWPQDAPPETSQKHSCSIALPYEVS